ncbi:hypothetical protein ABH931_004667 [Streptacidiphilus sp. MAP12-33]|uniref:DUF3592 domain-containing protein n=1 Tax=Streptacidiphilus sp. MAP12-33 TaxID=3156266 RepID=UPI003513F019
MMGEASGGFGVVFGLVGLFFGVVGCALAISSARRLWFRQAALARGLMAEAGCVETFVSRSHNSEGGTSTTRHMILAFRTQDGAEIRLDRTAGTLLVGDVVPVRYLPEHPQRATVVAPGAGRESVGLFIGVAFGLLFGGMGLFFAATGFGS